MHDRRFSNLPWYEKAKASEVLIAGLGGVGSWLSLFLSRANVNVSGCDHDIVEETNLGGQMFTERNLTHSKTLGMTLLLQEHCPSATFHFVKEKYAYNLFNLQNIIGWFSCVDDMEVRAQLFEDFLKYAPDDSIFIDSRMGAENFFVYAVTKDRAEMYKETLFASSEAIDEGCTTRATSHCGATCASIATSLFLNHLCEEEEMRDIPFVTKMILPNMLLL